MAERSPARTLSVLYVGRGELFEFREALRQLEASAALARTTSLDEACELVATARFEPDLIVLEQPRPGEPDAAQRLQCAAPLSGLWVLSGSWSDGEERTGRPAPSVPRLAWSEFGSRWAAELDRWSRGQPTSWQMPFTTTPEERLLGRQALRCDAPTPPIHVAIYGERVTSLQWLVDACRAHGADVVGSGWVSPALAPNAELAILDAEEWTPAARRALRAVESAAPRARRVLLLNFPRWQDVVEAESQGAHAMYQKPLPLATLEREILPSVSRTARRVGTPARP